MVQVGQQGARQGHGNDVPQAGVGQGRGEFDLVGKQDAGDGKQQVALGGHGARLVGQKKGLIDGDQGPRPGAAAD